jgi:hypothetical protein
MALVKSPSDPRSYNYRYLWLICLTATLGGFLFGYDWVVVGGAKEFYEAHFGITGDLAKGWRSIRSLSRPCCGW